MEENVNTILGVEPTETPKPNTPDYSQLHSTSQPTTPERVLSILAIVILVVGGLASFVLFINAFRWNSTFSLFLSYTVGAIFYTLLTWSLLKLFVQIAKTLREINSKLK